MSTVRLMHITEAANLPSIMREGLRLCRPRVPEQRRRFRKAGLPTKVLYAWHTRNARRMVKIAKDVAYWDVWGWRANAVLDATKGQPPWRVRRALCRERPRVEDAAFVALLFDVPWLRSWIGARYWHKPKSPEQGPVYDLLDKRYRHLEVACILQQPVPPDTIRLWATLWTTSTWMRDAGWETTVRFRRAV